MTGEYRMDKQVMRAQFESWVLREYPNQNMGRFSDGEYHSTTVQYCWLSWQASREAVEVELPKEDGCRTSTTEDEAAQASYNRALVECKAAIEAQGLKVKP